MSKKKPDIRELDVEVVAYVKRYDISFQGAGISERLGPFFNEEIAKEAEKNRRKYYEKNGWYTSDERYHYGNLIRQGQSSSTGAEIEVKMNEELLPLSKLGGAKSMPVSMELSGKRGYKGNFKTKIEFVSEEEFWEQFPSWL